MKLEIKDFCIRCGLCEDLYPELFKLNLSEDKIDVLFDEIPEEYHEKARGAAADCAVTCIFLVHHDKAYPDGRRKTKD